MEFDPNNLVVKCCINGMAMEDKGDASAALNYFMQAWGGAANEFEKYLAAYFIARHHSEPAVKLSWLERSLQSALSVNKDSVNGALPVLYEKIAECYDALGNKLQAKNSRRSAIASTNQITDKGPFYHGTRVALQVGELLSPGNRSNYHHGVVMNHIYFTALVNGAGLAAALAKGEGEERVYLVEPTGPFEHDPNVTNKKFPGNPTRSYRSTSPLMIIGEVTDWQRQTTANIQNWKQKLANNKGKIIN